MQSSLEDRARQSLFIIKDSSITRKLTLPPDWSMATALNPPQVVSCVQRGAQRGQFTLLILEESEFADCLQVVRQAISRESLARFGILVISADPNLFFREHQGIPELLEIIPEKDIKRSSEFHLLRALRHLLRGEGRDYKRVSKKTLEKLNEIFIALSAERDPHRLLPTILTKSMELTNAQGGVLYMVQETDGELYFRLKIGGEGGPGKIQPAQMKVLENSICGFVALTGKPLNIADVDELKPLTLPQHNRGVDYSREPKTKSLLTIPLKNSRNEIIAVLQLANKRNEMDLAADPSDDKPLEFVSFEAEDESLLSSFATQAAICLENVDLYADIRRLFEGFVRASITAIESRDPSTGGHSERVAKMTVALARATTECEVGIYRSVRFKEEEIRELEYAALLHDFGKIGVREEVLVKAKKLYPYQLEGIKERIKVCKAAAKITHLEKRIKSGATDMTEREYAQRLTQLDEFWQIIQQANEPTVLKEESMVALDRIRAELLALPDGSSIALLNEEEYKALSVTKGSLTENERLEIESHVRHTYQFLKMIPWTKDFKHLPDIAYGHHEKLDGSGYPRGLTSHEIPLQSKMMTIADIFDALTAADRWYKEAVPTEKALDILAYEVAEGKIDPVLFELFVEKKLFEITQPKRLKQVG
jgi:HD-GYP domain-containing protein (c-di-GMP phosphodiesterase class II)